MFNTEHHKMSQPELHDPKISAKNKIIKNNN